MHPVVVDPDPSWPARAAKLARRLNAALGPQVLRVEHIGSTSIPGMAAKDILDMQISVADLDAAEAAFSGPLDELGFVLSAYRMDHVVSEDPALWAKRLWTRRPDDPVNLHVRVAGSPNERLALLFRDWFRANPGAVGPYAQFKRVLAASVDDTGVYTDVKDPVVDLVVWVAEGWAFETGWTP